MINKIKTIKYEVYQGLPFFSSEKKKENEKCEVHSKKSPNEKNSKAC